MNRYRCNTLNKKILSRIKKRKIFERCYDGSVTFVISTGRYPGDLWVGLRLPWLPDASVWSGAGELVLRLRDEQVLRLRDEQVVRLRDEHVGCPVSHECSMSCCHCRRGLAGSRRFPPIPSHITAARHVSLSVTVRYAGCYVTSHRASRYVTLTGTQGVTESVTGNRHYVFLPRQPSHRSSHRSSHFPPHQSSLRPAVTFRHIRRHTDRQHHSERHRASARST